MANVWQPIDNGQIQSAARFYSLTVPAGESRTIYSPFNVCKCISSNQTTFKVAWSSQNSATDFAQGWKVKFETVIPSVQVFNDGSSDLNVVLGLGIGDIDDSSFVLSNSQITVQQSRPATFQCLGVTLSEYGTAYYNPPSYVLKFFIQNQTSGDIRLYNNSVGTIIKPMGTFETNQTGGIQIYGNPNEKISVGFFRS